MSALAEGFSVVSSVISDVNECLLGNICGRHVCVNLEGSYRCECQNGFVLNSITKQCKGLFFSVLIACAHELMFYYINKLLLWNCSFSRSSQFESN